MIPSTFICFLATAFVSIAVILAGVDRWRIGQRFVFVLILALFLFAGFRSLAINSDTRSYADYALQFQQTGVGGDAEISDRLEWGFRLLLRLFAILLPTLDEETYPRLVNIIISVLGCLLLSRAAKAARGKTGAIFLIYLCSLFFVHQFAIVRLGLATLFFLNYFVPSSTHPKFYWTDFAFLAAGCLLHYTLLITAVILLSWEAGLRLVRRPVSELVSFFSFILAAAVSGVLAERFAPMFLSGYRLSLVARNPELGLSPKGMLEVTLCVTLFLFHFKKIHWSRDHRHLRWRVLFYMTLVSFIVEAASGLPFVGRFRILAYCLFLIQTVLITTGINFGKRSTWIILLAAAASIAAQVITISRDEGWFVIIAGP